MNACLPLYRPIERDITQHVLVRLIEEWRKDLDDDYVAGGVLMGPSKAFDCIPYDILIARLDSYGLIEI